MTRAVELAQVASLGVSEAFKNRIINGAMVIDQRNAGASVTVSTTGQYVLDRWRFRAFGGGQYSVQQSTIVPAGFYNSVACTVTTADSSIAAGDNYYFFQEVEGYNAADLDFGTANAKTITISFWVRSSITGTYSVFLSNGQTYDRGYVATYTINSANTYEYKTVTIAGDTTGTWGKTNGGGLTVGFNLGAGTDYQTTANSWVNSFRQATSGTTQWIATSGATFYATGVQLEVGSSATSFEYRPYGTELLLCQRYYWKYNNNYIVSGFNENSSGFLAAFTLPTQMRTAPTMGTDASATYRIRIPGATVTVTSLAGDSATVSSLRMVAGTSGGLTAGQGSVLIADTNRFLDFSAEL